ncbi:ABC-2 type transporter, putative [Babesia ovis]|uniref:ABC-2 type transporter, putative n=1 Tax=Babesia ovis TaxID=5869 RepID=A0A9W5TF19_BABOV|nr:ABC-2 type transporter, putative [Babesia ovis]
MRPMQKPRTATSWQDLRLKPSGIHPAQTGSKLSCGRREKYMLLRILYTVAELMDRNGVISRRAYSEVDQLLPLEKVSKWRYTEVGLANWEEINVAKQQLPLLVKQLQKLPPGHGGIAGEDAGNAVARFLQSLTYRLESGNHPYYLLITGCLLEALVEDARESPGTFCYNSVNNPGNDLRKCWVGSLLRKSRSKSSKLAVLLRSILITVL